MRFLALIMAVGLFSTAVLSANPAIIWGGGGYADNLAPSGIKMKSGRLLQDTGTGISTDGNMTISGTTTLNSSLTGPLKGTSGVVSSGAINLASEVTGILPIANGGTGSSTQNFVDLSTNQTVGGDKSFTGHTSMSSTGSSHTLTMTHSGTGDSLHITQSGSGQAIDSTGEILFKDTAGGLDPFVRIMDNAASTSYFSVNASGMQLDSTGARVTTILDEDNMVSDSATALATQQSIKAYVDAVIPSQSGNGGKYLRTNGSVLAWQNVNNDTADIKTNLLLCPSFEGCGLSTDSWVVTTDASFDGSGTGVRTIEPSAYNDSQAYFEGLISPTWDIKAVMTKTVDFEGQQMKAYCEIRTLRPDVKFIAGANAVSAGEQNVINDNKWRFYEVFLVGGDTSQYIEINGETTASSEPIYIDNCFIGKVSPTDIREVSGAQFVGSATELGAAGCNNQTTVTTAGTWYDMSTDIDCGAYTNIGSVIGVNNKNEISIENARTDGYYKINFSSITAATSGNCQFRFHDGNTFFGFLHSQSYTTTPPSLLSDSNVSGEVRFETGGSKTIKLRVNSTSGGSTCSTFNDFADDRRTKKWSVYFFPDSTSDIVTQNFELTAKTANEFVANVSSTGVVSGENFDWLSVSKGGTGAYSVTFTSGIFSQIPVCLVRNTGDTGADLGVHQRNETLSGFDYVTRVTLDGLGAALTDSSVSIKCTRSSTDYNKSATIIGKFENINSSELVKVQYKSNGGQAIAANVTDITWSTKDYDNYNAWNGTQFTAPKSSHYTANVGTRTTSNSGHIIKAYINGVDSGRRGILPTPYIISNYVFQGIYLNEGDILSFRSDGAVTLEVDSSYHIINITELPDTESIIKNLMPDVAEIYVYANTSSHTITTSETNHPFTNEVEDTHNAYNPTTGVFTAPRNCLCDISFFVSTADLSLATSQNFRALFSLSDGRIFSGVNSKGTGSSQNQQINASYTVRFNQGDTAVVRSVLSTGSVSARSGANNNFLTISCR